MQRMLMQTGRPVTMASRGVVSAPHYLGTEAGVWALRQGGTAVDAAVAANAVLAVVYPHMAGLGGDALFMLWHPSRPRPICLNGSGHSGYQATIRFYQDRGHETIPARGPLAANTVPAAVAAWADVHARWGKLPWEQLFEPAIHYADHGFPVSANLAEWLERDSKILERHETTRRTFLRDGVPYRQGEVLVQKDLANTLRLVADDGPEILYSGELGDALAAYLEAHGAPLARQDLADHHSDWVDPLSATYRGHTVFEFPPNSQGLTALLILNLLAHHDVALMGDCSAQYYHYMVEASKAALAEVDARIADPNYAPLPLEQLLSPVYAGRRSDLILPNRARPLADYAAGALLREEVCPPALEPAGATAGIVVVDGEGFTVSLIQSLHSEFGSAVVAGDTGILLQNSGAAFTLHPREANRLQPHKRPYQPLMPALVFDGERPWLAFGASGAQGEPQTHAALITRVIDFGCNIQQAIEGPRWLYGATPGLEAPDLNIEGRVPDSVLRQLREMGHEVRVRGDWSELMGQVQGIMVDWERGVLHGGADPRGDGQAIGW